MLFDIHIHTCFSPDCVSSPDRLLRAAKAKGLNAVAITDHNTIRGALETRERNSDPEFQVIVGSEIATDAGDIIGLFLTEEITSRVALDVIREIHDQQGLALLPHPFQGQFPRDDIAVRVDLIETFNARSSPESNRKAAELAQRLGKPAVCASDAHFVSDVGTCTMMLLGDRDLRTALLRGANMLHKNYTPRYRMPASQIIKAWKTRTYRRIPLNAASMVKRLVMG